MRASCDKPWRLARGTRQQAARALSTPHWMAHGHSPLPTSFCFLVPDPTCLAWFGANLMPVLPVKYSREPYLRADGHDCFPTRVESGLVQMPPGRGEQGHAASQDDKMTDGGLDGSQVSPHAHPLTRPEFPSSHLPLLCLESFPRQWNHGHESTKETREGTKDRHHGILSRRDAIDMAVKSRSALCTFLPVHLTVCPSDTSDGIRATESGQR